MALKTFKPYTPARRNMTVSAFEGVDKKAKPERGLVETLKKNSGRNNYGRITVRHHGGGNKRKYRVIDFRRDKLDVPATVLRLEYDPNRTAYIALVEYEDGERRYVLAPVGLKPGDKILSSAARSRRAVGPVRRHRCPAHGEGRRSGPGQNALRRVPLCADELQGHHRPGR